jgi:hypothetical protein
MGLATRFVAGFFVLLLLIASGTGCSEKTSEVPSAAVADETPVENDAESGPVLIDGEFQIDEIEPSSRASSRR